MKKIYLTVLANAFLIVFFSLSALVVKAQNPVKGKIDVVRNANNALVLKLSVQADLKSLGSATIIFSYNHNVISLAEDPKPATSNSVENGDFYYNPAFINNTDYLRKDITRPIVSEGDPGEIRYTYANIDYAFPATSTAISINSWTEIATVKFAVIGTGSANLDFLLDPNEMVLMDDNANTFDLDPANFTVPAISVTYMTPKLKLTSSGIGTIENPFLVKLKSNDTDEKPAGTTGFYIYYNDQEVTYVTATDLLNTGSFGWTNASIMDEAISDVFKGGELYNRRVVYTNNDGSQGDDEWPGSNATAAENVLAVRFTPLDADGFKTYLEPINELAHKNPDESEIYPQLVPTPYRNVGVNDPLPVTLLSFTATMADKKEVLLKWATSSEKNNDRFEVERSSNGREFYAILSQKGQGTTSEFHSYSATDLKPLAGISYYRLKQVDFDGQFSYSKSVVINNGSSLKDLVINAVYPNPAKTEATLTFNLAVNNKVTLQITNILGQIVTVQELKGKAGKNETAVTGLENLPGGVYFINLQNDTQKVVYKLVKE